MTDRYAALFTERLAAAGLPGLVHEASVSGVDDHRVLRVSVCLTEEWDWGARYDVLKQASDFQTGSGLPVVCEFKPLDAVARTA
ncbi:MAG: hypothetical protein QOH14_2338 [Pseudonocardiales bacterium]|jgi:hypothetical protein|nr:hypothetical protein [Pseudonocardiales bacterium]